MASNSRRLRVALEAVTMLGFITSCALVLWTFLPWVPQLPEVVLVPLLITLLIVWFPTILQIAVGMRAQYGSLLRLSAGDLMSALPQWAKTLAVAFAIGLVVSALTAVPSIVQGNPDMQGGKLIINEHGTIVEVTNAQYWTSVAAHERFASAIMALFFGFAIMARMVLKSKRPSKTTSTPATGR